MSQKQPDAPKMHVIARAPFEVYFEGEANSLTAENKVGVFDVLPGHADFFSMLLPGEVIIETDAEPIKFNIVNGIITVRNDQVMLFANI